jgi:hypothetical protein
MANHATFANGVLACNIEAIFHFSGILLQFFSIALGGWRNYKAVVYGKTMSQRTAVTLIAIAMAISVGGTVLTSQYSPIYLMPAGLYCFFEFQVLTYLLLYPNG